MNTVNKALNDTPRRTVWERMFHWLVALCCIIALGTGYIITDTGWNGIGLITRATLQETHKSLGLIVVPVAVLWALVGLRGAFVSRTTFNRAIWLAHAVLAIGFLVIATLGWAGSSSGRYGQDFFGLIPFPEIMPTRDPGRAVFLYDLHKTLSWWTMMLLGAHILGALFHLLVLRDGRFSAMLSGRRKEAEDDLRGAR